jgi:glutamate-1-semialdehyde 2,1-aminomutase
VPWNDLAALEAAITRCGDRLAGAIAEPVLGSGGLVEPAPGFLAALCDRVRGAGGLVVFDEVMTGFRVARGGAQERYGVIPDVTTLGKIVGGGFALSAFGGSREVMRLEAENKVVHGGTYTGSPVVLAASSAVLRKLAAEPELYDVLEARSALLAAGIEEAMSRAGVEGHVRRVASMLQPILSARPEEEPRSVGEVAVLQDPDRYARFCDGLEEAGVYSHRYALGRWFVSLAHEESDLDETLAAVESALAGL